jgi:hypothetical protein
MSGAPICIGISQRAEDHDQPVQRRHRVEELGIDDLQAGLEELAADRQRHDAADEEHREREPQVHRADVLVVGRRDPAHDPLRVMRVLAVRNAADDEIVWDAGHCGLLGYLRSAFTADGCTTFSPALLPQLLRV